MMGDHIDRLEIMHVQVPSVAHNCHHSSGDLRPFGCTASWGTKVGVLTCNTSASLGLLVGSHQKLKCSFKPDSGGTPENYVGHVNRLGLDVGVKAGGAMAWGVFAPTNGYHHGALAGKYRRRLRG